MSRIIRDFPRDRHARFSGDFCEEAHREFRPPKHIIYHSIIYDVFIQIDSRRESNTIRETTINKRHGDTKFDTVLLASTQFQIEPGKTRLDQRSSSRSPRFSSNRNTSKNAVARSISTQVSSCDRFPPRSDDSTPVSQAP